MNKLPNKKVLITIFVVSVAIIVGLIIYFDMQKARIHIISDPAAVIFVTEQRGGEFTQLGLGDVTYKTTSVDPVFIRSILDEKVTVTSVVPVRGETTTIEMNHQDIVESELVVEESFAKPLITNDAVYGINPSTNSIDAESRTGERFAYMFFELPFIRDVSWIDSENFFYSSFGDGLGRVISGEKSKLLDDRLRSYMDFAKASERPFVLLDINSISTLDSLQSSKIKKLTDITIKNAPKIDADNQYIYITDTEYDETEDEGDDPDIVGVYLTIYDYDGRLVSRNNYDFESPGTKAIGIPGSEAIVVLTEETVEIINQNSGVVDSEQLYFLAVSDFIATESGLFYFNEDGLWRYDLMNGQIYLVTGLPDGGEYVPGSLVEQNDGVVFSTTLNKEQLKLANFVGRDAVYRVKF